MRNKNGGGFAHLELIVVLIVVGLIGLAGWTVYHKQSNSPKTSQTATKAASDQPLLLESVGFNLDYYNPATNRAGDMEFTNVDHTLSGHIHQIWQDFGQQDTRTTDPTKKNPQPTFVLPLHTKVHALV